MTVKSPRKILVWVDSAAERSATLEQGLRLAKQTGAAILLTDVVAEVPVQFREPRFGYPALSETLIKECNERLGKLAAHYRDESIAIESKALYGKPETAIVREVRKSGCDLVMLSGVDAGPANRVLRVCPTPVWAVKPGDTDPFHEILACVDPLSHAAADSTLNVRILETAVALAEMTKGQAYVAYAYGEGMSFEPEAAEMLDLVKEEAVEELAKLVAPYEKAFPEDRRLITPGSPTDAIPKILRERKIDLVIMGTRGRTGVGGLLLGNTAERILAAADCSALALKPDDFPSAED